MKYTSLKKQNKRGRQDSEASLEFHIQIRWNPPVLPKVVGETQTEMESAAQSLIPFISFFLSEGPKPDQEPHSSFWSYKNLLALCGSRCYGYRPFTTVTHCEFKAEKNKITKAEEVQPLMQNQVLSSFIVWCIFPERKWFVAWEQKVVLGSSCICRRSSDVREKKKVRLLWKLGHINTSILV